MASAYPRMAGVLKERGRDQTLAEHKEGWCSLSSSFCCSSTADTVGQVILCCGVCWFARVAAHKRDSFTLLEAGSLVKVSVGLALPQGSERGYVPCLSPNLLTMASVRA